MWRWIHSGGAFQALSILFGAGFTAAVAAGLGACLFGRAIKDWPARFITGAAVLNLAVFALCSMGLAYPAVFAALGAGVLVWWWRSVSLTGGPGAPAINRAIWLAFGAYFILYFFNAMAPEVSPDGSAYHLSLVARYLREHGFHRITWNLYADLSEGAEMLFLFAFAFGRHSAAALVHFAFLLALVWQMIAYGRRAGFPVAGACAALLVFVTPVVGIDAASAYNDVAAAAVAFTLFYLLQLWDAERSRQLLIPIGLVAGFGYAIKYTAWIGVPYAIGFAIWQGRRSGGLRQGSIIGAAAALLVVPWMGKNWLWVRNPLAPFFNNIFQNPYLTYSFESGYRHDLATYDLPSLWRIPGALTMSGALAGILGPVFWLSPLALLALRRREGRRLWLAALVFGANYFSNIGARFLIPPLPFVALALALAFGTGAAGRTLAMVVALAHAALSWPSIMLRYSPAGIWAIEKVPWREALRVRPEEEYLRSHLINYGVDPLIERCTAPGATIFSFQPVPESYTSRRILVSYESQEGLIDGLTLRTAFHPAWQPAWRAGFTFDRQPLRAIRIEQTAQGAKQWRIHEWKAFDGAAELPRSAWRMTAEPFPWGIERSIDGNLATFWQCGENLRPGMYVEADFGTTTNVDSVLIQTSPNQPDLRMQLEGQEASGNWKLLAREPDVSEAHVPDLRRAAIEELKRRGIGYMLIFDTDDIAADLRARIADWGVEPAGQSGGATLYKLQ